MAEQEYVGRAGYEPNAKIDRVARLIPPHFLLLDDPNYNENTNSKINRDCQIE